MRRARGWLGVVALATAVVAAPARASQMDSTLALGGAGTPVRVTLSPNIVKIGETALYRARVITWGRVEWLPPEPDTLLTWGAPRSGYALARPPGRRFGKDASKPAPAPGFLRPDTSWVEIPVQAFSPGVVNVPGLRFRAPGVYPAVSATPDSVRRVPMTRLIVVNVMTAADSAKGLKDVHGPTGAPWWERVAWKWVVGGLALGALVTLLVWWARRRRPAPAMAPAPLRFDPMAEALAELRALRDEHLPEHGRFAEHAFRLGRILRRYLEATVRFAMPGDSTPELVAHVRTGGLPNEDLQRLTALLRLWDRVKFAREPLTVEEAHRTEGAVEAFVRAKEAPPAATAGRVA